MDDVENPEDANELAIYKRLRDIEGRLDQLDEKHDKLREDYTYGIKGGRRKTRRKKKKRHIITRKKKRKRKRKRRRRTKKRRKGGMPKNSTQSKEIDKRIAQLKKSTFRPLKESKSLGSRLKKSSSFRSGLNTLANRASPSTKMFKTAPIETQLANLDLSSPQQSQKQQQTSKSKE